MRFRNPPALRMQVHGLDKVRAYFNSGMRLLSSARAEGKGGSVRATFDDQESADLWDHLWSMHGITCERLLGNVRFFEVDAQGLQKMPGLPAPRPDAGQATVTLN